jgi:hypothetical protein
MRHEAHGQAATPHRASPGRRRCGTRPSKKDSTRMQQGCTLNTRMGPGPARYFTADIAQPNPGSPRRGDCSPTYPRVQRRSACIPVKPCLLRRDPHAAATGPRTLRAGQNPMHQFRPPCRRDRGAGRTHAPVRTTASGLLQPPRCSAGPSQRHKTPCTNSARCGEGGVSAGVLHGGDKTPCTNSARHGGRQADQRDSRRQRPTSSGTARPVSHLAGRAPRHERPAPPTPRRRLPARQRCDTRHGKCQTTSKTGPPAAQCGTRRGKGMEPPMHTDAHRWSESDTAIHGEHRKTNPGERPRSGGPVLSVCIGVHRWFQILVWSRGAPGCRRVGHHHKQNPMHQFGRAAVTEPACTMRRIAETRRHTGLLPVRQRCGTRHSKQDSTQMQKDTR